MNDYGNIIKRQDGSYLITRNNMPYHVPDGEEFAALFADVKKYAEANPDKVTQEVPPPPPTPEEQQAAMLDAFTTAIQAHLDSFARTRNYDGIMSAATYATSTIPRFKREGQYAVEARDTTWAKAYAILDDVMGGKRPMPTLEGVIAELPPLTWPA